jgi:hypothetical protein
LETRNRRTRLGCSLGRAFDMRQRLRSSEPMFFSLCGTSEKSILSRLRDREDPSKRWRMDSFFVENLKLGYQHNRMQRIGQMPKRSSRAMTDQHHALPRSEARERLEQSKLIELAGAICSDINVRAGELIVESQSYLPPQAILRSFVFVSGSAEHVMRIKLGISGPVVSFFTRKWRDSSPNPCVRLLYRLGALESVRVRFKFTRSIDEDRLTREEMETWFRYLLSGLRPKFRPSKRSGFGPRSDPSERAAQKTDLAALKASVARS